MRGNANDDGKLDIADPIWITSNLFKNGPGVACQDAADSNDDGRIDSADIVYLIGYLLQGGARPAEPFPICGTGRECEDDDGLTCDAKVELGQACLADQDRGIDDNYSYFRDSRSASSRNRVLPPRAGVGLLVAAGVERSSSCERRPAFCRVGSTYRGAARRPAVQPPLLPQKKAEAIMGGMRAYLDRCALKRSYDKPTQDRVVLEALAVAAVLAAFEQGRVEIVSSALLELENSKNTLIERRDDVTALLGHFPDVVLADSAVIQRAHQVGTLGIRPLDALHVSSAERGRCDYLVTCDDQFLRAATRAASNLHVQRVDPLRMAGLLPPNGET